MNEPTIIYIFFFFVANCHVINSKALGHQWHVNATVHKMIFEELFGNNFCDNLSFISFHWSKTIERKRKRENKNIM